LSGDSLGKLMPKSLMVFLGILAFGIVCKLVWLQVIDAGRLSSEAENLHTYTSVIHAKRGTIYDRNGNVLAMSVECDTVVADPTQVSDAQATAAVCAEYLGGEASDYYAKLTKQNTQYVQLATQVDANVASDLNSDLATKDLPGLYLEADTKRVYPYGEVAGQVLGLVDADGQGQTGLEYYYNDILSGTDGSITREQGSYGTPIAGGAYTEVPAKDGTDIVISLDVNIQEMAETKIVEGQEQYNAETGFVCVTDPSTGEILAMCSTPLLDPTDRSNIQEGATSLRNVIDSYEPGSVIKVLTMAIGIDNGLVNENSTFTVNPKVTVGSDLVGDDDERDYVMDMNLREILRRSSNTGAVMVERAIGDDVFTQGLAKFGIGSLTGIDYPGEVVGLVATPGETTNVQAEVMSFGQGLAIPQIQVVRAIGAIANHGLLTTPHFLVYKGSTKVEWPDGPEACSPQTAATVTDLMRTVVTEGTAQKAAVSGYDIAAKTGTGEQASEDAAGYKEYSYLSSLVGFAPASDAEVLVYVAFNGTSYLASDSAAPVFSAIMGEALLDMGVKPSS
jgi:cell division protein FtsI (penicillin-binding protein 3)